MNFMTSAVVFVVVAVTLSAAATTTHPHHHHHQTTTHRPHHSGTSVSFYYDAPSHYLIMNKDGYCYFVDLTPSEEQDVHNPDGLRRLEIAVLNMHGTSSHQPLTGLDHAHVSRYVYSHVCQNEALIKLVQ